MRLLRAFRRLLARLANRYASVELMLAELGVDTDKLIRRGKR